MRLTYDFMEFEGEINDLIELCAFSKAVRKTLDFDTRYNPPPGGSYTLDSFRTWDDDDADEAG
jgi:hypothetical protein